MIYKREIPQKYDVDVFVAGGGPAGVAAAISAARMGKSVFLAEASGSFGGMGTNGLVPVFMMFGDGEHFLVGDIGREIRDRISPNRSNSPQSYFIHTEKLKQIYDEMMEESGVQFSFFTSLIDVIAENGKVIQAILSAKSGIFAVKAKIFIDCTGDGDLCAMAGAPYEKGDEKGNTMPPTLCSMWANIRFPGARGMDMEKLEQAIEDGVFSTPDRHVPGMFAVRSREGIAIANVGHCFGVDGTDEVSLTQGMLSGRRQVREFEHFYREYMKEGYENMSLCTTAPMLGVRESRRILGDYVLNVEDFKKQSSFPDEIGRYCYPVDIHIMSPDREAYKEYFDLFTNLRYKGGESYGIPYRSLIPQKLINVLVAGRCISADRYMQSSLRVMPCCFLTGQAAGIAAALSPDGTARAVPVQKMQRRLSESGVYLPNLKC